MYKNTLKETKVHHHFILPSNKSNFKGNIKFLNIKISLKSLWRPGKILDFRMLKQWTKI